MAVSAHAAGIAHAHALISAGKVNSSDNWDFSAADSDKLLGNPPDWSAYAKWFLGEDTAATEQTKARYKYPFGKNGVLYRSALRAIASRAAQNNETAISNAASAMLAQLDKPKAFKSEDAPVHRAFSLIKIKGFDPITRSFTGIATSPVPDRVGDTIESSGVTAAPAIPLHLYHDSRKPVGEAMLGRPGKGGTPFSARISTIDSTSGVIKDRLDEAVDSLRANPPLIRAVSIGFRPLEDPTYDKSTGGFNFSKIEVLELSMVSIPAHQDATIDLAKSLYLAASGHSQSSAGVSASRTVKAVPKDRDAMKVKICDQIKTLKTELVATIAERDQLDDTIAESGTLPDSEQEEKYDELKVKIKALNGHIARLTEREKEQLEKAVEVVENEERKPIGAIEVKQSIRMGDHMGTVEPGLALARLAICKGAAFESRTRGDGDVSAIQIAKTWFPYDPRIVQHLQTKTAVAGGTVSDTNWASPLAPLNTIGSDFIAFLRGKTIIDSFGVNGVPPLRSLPFNVKVPRQTSGFTGYWVGEGKAKPVSKGQFDTVTMDYTKAAAIAVITRELVRYQVANADQIVRNDLAKAVMARLDTDFVDPAKAVSSHVNPASLTNGVTSKATAGTSAANVLTDVEKLVAPFLNNNYDPSSLVLIMPNTLCLALSLMVTTNGVRQFPNIGIGGGNLAGLPVIGSYYAGSLASYGNMVLCVSADNVGKADDGVVDVSVSTEGSVEMSDAPGGDETAGTGASVVSLWQTNSIGILAERFISWAKLRTTAVTWMQDVNWGSVGSPRNT